MKNKTIKLTHEKITEAVDTICALAERSTYTTEEKVLLLGAGKTVLEVTGASLARQSHALNRYLKERDKTKEYIKRFVKESGGLPKTEKSLFWKNVSERLTNYKSLGHYDPKGTEKLFFEPKQPKSVTQGKH